MDPLSITASAVAIGGLLKGMLDAAAAVRELQKADDGVFILLNELSDLALVVQDVAHVFGQLEARPAKASMSMPTASLAQFLHRAEEILHELQTLVQYDLLTPASTSAHFKVNRTAWLRKRGKAQVLKDRLKDARLNIVANLGVLGCGTGHEVHIELKEIREELEGMRRARAGGLAAAIKVDDEQAVQQMETVEVVKPPPPEQPCKHNLQSTSLNGTVPHPTSYHAFEVRMVRGSNIKCDTRCACQCHLSTYIKTPSTLQKLIGSLFLGYSNVPLLNRGCNDRFCKRHFIAISAVYRFPRWLCQKQLRIFADQPEFLLRITRVRPTKSLIFTFARKNYVPGLKHLLSSGQASVLDVDELGRNALFVAVYYAAMDSVRFLLQQSSDARQTTRSGWSALHEAWLCILICSNTPFKPFFTDESDIEIFGLSKLHQAVVGLNKQNVENALEYWQNRDVDIRDDQGNTPLAWAARRNDQKATRLLLDQGANPNLRIQGGLTPLISSGNHCGAFQHFTYPGLHLNTRSPNGENLLHVVLRHRHPQRRGCVQCIENLIARGVSISHKNKFGLSPFHLACETAAPATIELLLRHGADLEQLTGKGNTPLLRAIVNRNHGVVNLLLSHGANVHALSSTGSSILHLSALYGDQKLFDTLAKWHLPAYLLRWRNDCGKSPGDIQLARSKRRWVSVFLDMNMYWPAGSNGKKPCLACHKEAWLRSWQKLVRESLAEGPEPDPEVLKKQKTSKNSVSKKSSAAAEVGNSLAWAHLRAASLDAIPFLDPSTKSLLFSLGALVLIWLLGYVQERRQRATRCR